MVWPLCVQCNVGVGSDSDLKVAAELGPSSVLLPRPDIADQAGYVGLVPTGDIVDCAQVAAKL